MTNNFTKPGSSATELDFTEHWSFFNVQQEILRGMQLRQGKEKVAEAEYDLIDVDFSIPSCSTRQKYKEFNQYRPTTLNLTHRRSRKVTKKRRLKMTSKHKSKDHCPLRVVELAVPLKRHCLNTWKNNCHILPDYMVERLRRHIEDKNPIVHISDAVNYFKRTKPPSRKWSSKRYKSISKYCSDRNIRDLLLLCAIFGYKITRKLISPANIILSAELAKINHIVRDEISSILRNNKGKNIYKNDEVLAEISKKVTIWIASVLEETSYKQLLEQLHDLEEEEGPVLHFIDELLDNIQIPCESSASTEFTEVKDIISSIASKDNVEVTDSIYDNFSKDTIDIQKHDYIVPAHIDQLLYKNVEESISDYEINDINEKNDTINHLRNLLDDRINYIVNYVDKKNISNNKASAGSKDDSSASMKNANIELPLSLENNINNQLLDTDENNISKGDTLISLDDLETDKTKNNTASAGSKAELSPNMENAINEMPLNLEFNVNNLLPTTNKEYIDKKDTFISLDGLEADKTINNTTSAGSKGQLSTSMENSINELPLNLENNVNNLQLSTDKEFIDKEGTFISKDGLETDNTKKNTASAGSKPELSSIENAINELPLSLEKKINKVLTKDEEYIQNDKIISLEDTSETERPKDNTSENIKQSNFLAEGTHEQQNYSNLKSDTVDEDDDLTEEEIHEGTKKVKFSDILRDYIRKNTGINNGFELVSYDYKEPVIWKSSKDYITSHFHVAPPNPNLLSDMDELWPDFLPPLLKLTESVSKSITSLGRIIESDEGSLMSPINKRSMENIKNTVNKGPEFTNIMSVDEDMRKQIDNIALEDDFLNEVFTKEWQRESKSTTDKMFMDNIQHPKILQTTTEKVTQDCGDVKSTKPKRYTATQCVVLHTKRSLTKKILNTISNNAIVDNTPMKVDKNVKTDSVIMNSDSDEVCSTHYDVQKWCLGLQNVTENFELWAEWIQNVCLNVLLLKHKEKTSKSCQFTTKHINKWVNLKKSIDFDVHRWFELKRSLHCGLKIYKKTYYRVQKAPSIQADKKSCKCNKNSKNMFLISTNGL